MICIGADSIDGLLEADLDLEAHAIEFDDLEPGQRKIGGQEHLSATGGVDDQDEADEMPDRLPAEVQDAVPKHYILFAVDRALRADERLFLLEEGFDRDSCSICPGPSSFGFCAGLKGFIGDGVGSYRRDQMIADLQERVDHLGGCIVRVGDQIGWQGNLKRTKQCYQLVQQCAVMAIGKDDSLVNAGSQWDRDEAAGGPDDNPHGLAGMSVDELRLCVVVRLLVKLLDPWHLPPGLGDLDPVSHQDDASLDRVEKRLEERKDKACP